MPDMQTVNCSVTQNEKKKKKKRRSLNNNLHESRKSFILILEFYWEEKIGFKDIFDKEK